MTSVIYSNLSLPIQKELNGWKVALNFRKQSEEGQEARPENLTYYYQTVLHEKMVGLFFHIHLVRLSVFLFVQLFLGKMHLWIIFMRVKLHGSYNHTPILQWALHLSVQSIHGACGYLHICYMLMALWDKTIWPSVGEMRKRNLYFNEVCISFQLYLFRSLLPNFGIFKLVLTIFLCLLKQVISICFLWTLCIYCCGM